MKKTTLILLSILGIILCTKAQIPMGEWRTHFAYNNVNQITQSPNKVFAVSDGTLFSVDKRDGSKEFYSKINGLNGTIISRIKYDDASKSLLIIYSNGNIDFLTENGVENLPDYFNKQMSVDKSVNHILFNGKQAYLSCNFGVLVLDDARREIKETYYIGANATEVKVLSTSIFQNNIYAASASDIYYASLSDPYLISYEHWKKMSALPGSGSIKMLLNFGDNLILLRDGKLYKYGTDNVWTNLDVLNNYTNIVVAGDYLQCSTSTKNLLYNKQFTSVAIPNLTEIFDGLYDATSSLFWFAVGAKGLVQYNMSNATISEYIKPDGPAVNSPYNMRFAGQKLFVVQGGRWDAQYNIPGLVMIYENNIWKNIDNQTIATKTGKNVLDFTDIGIDPADNKHFFIPSFGTGLYEFKNDEFYKWYSPDNSPLQSFYASDYKYIRVEGSLYDEAGNLWLLNPSAKDNKIKILKPDGNWNAINDPNINTKHTFSAPLISNVNKNQKWVLSLRVLPGVSIFDDNGTLDNANDDKSIFYSSFTNPDGGDVIAPSFYFCMAQDKNGVMWVGTSEGPLLFNNTNKAFDAGFTCSKVKIPRNDGTNLADYLLEGEMIKAIAVDGANRKWIGTATSGVYLMSENGQETIHHFTAENSPLLSNAILSIAVNPQTGEVFFGTSNGLVSFQSDAAEGEDYFQQVHTYPNPVRENYDGLITITGLIDKTNVKITDLSGNLVVQTVSNGSIATWDGRNGYGKKVSTGVYVAVCVSPDGTQSTTTKILIIN